VIISDTEDTVFKVDGERYAVEAAITGQASEAAGVIGLSHCLQYLYGTHTNNTHTASCIIDVIAVMMP